jgi:hypothetical protein
VYAPDGSITGIGHAWAFDDMFSTYATQGLESKEKGKFTRDELAPLAKDNVESLKELVVSQFEFCPTLHFGKTGIRKLDGIVFADLQPTVLNCVFEASLKFCCRPTGLSEGKVALPSHKHVIWTTVI